MPGEVGNEREETECFGRSGKARRGMVPLARRAYAKFAR